MYFMQKLSLLFELHMFVAAATTDSTVVVDGAGIIIAGETMASMTGAVVGPGVSHSR